MEGGAATADALPLPRLTLHFKGGRDTRSGCNFLPMFDGKYFNKFRKSFNTAQYIGKHFHFDDSVFHSSLYYQHLFVATHGLDAISDVLLIAACVFLAAKVSHYKFRAQKFAMLAFDLPESSPCSSGETDMKGGDDLINEWVAALLDAELLLCDTLAFNFHVSNPMSSVESILMDAQEEEGDIGSRAVRRAVTKNDAEEEETEVFVARVITIVKRLLIFLLLSPLQNRLSSEEVNAALIYLVVRFLVFSLQIESNTSSINEEEPLTPSSGPSLAPITLLLVSSYGNITPWKKRFTQKVMQKINIPPVSDLNGVLEVIVETFVRMNKPTDIPQIDTIIREEHQRRGFASEKKR